MVIRFIPNVKPIGNQRFDYLGAITLFVALLLFLLGLTIGQNQGFTNIRVLILIIGSCLFLTGFIFIELNTRQPMIDLRLFKNKLFSINLVTGLLTFVAIAGSTMLMPFYLENVLGYSTREVGILLSVVPVSMGIIAPISGSFSDRFGTRPMTVIGLVVLLIGYAALSTLTIATSTIGYILRFLPVGLGMGIFQSPNNSAIMGVAPKGRLGIVSGMLAVNRTLGQTTGIAILGALWASRALYYTEPLFVQSATDAPAQAQVSALSDTFLFVSILIIGALGLAVFALLKENQEKRTRCEKTPTPIYD
jgi:MFS family permease